MREIEMSIALITGCSRGIGLLTALHFGRSGHSVFASMRDTALREELETTAREEKLPIEIMP
jgi:NAD(P)-dependent dehydrogenase (short-subunit alcohol dehydrogenase family)